MRVQYVSNLHLDVDNRYSSYRIPRKAPVLILGGNTGRLADYVEYRAFLLRLATGKCSFQQVYFILGPREFDGLTKTEALTLAARLETDPALRGKVQVLHRRKLRLTFGTILLGCSLVDVRSANALDTRPPLVREWSFQDQSTDRAADLLWLKEQIQAIRDDPSTSKCRILVATHGVVRSQPRNNVVTGSTNCHSAKTSLDEPMFMPSLASSRSTSCGSASSSDTGCCFPPTPTNEPLYRTNEDRQQPAFVLPLRDGLLPDPNDAWSADRYSPEEHITRFKPSEAGCFFESAEFTSSFEAKRRSASVAQAASGEHDDVDELDLGHETSWWINSTALPITGPVRQLTNSRFAGRLCQERELGWIASVLAALGLGRLEDKLYEAGRCIEVDSKMVGVA